MCLTLRLWFGWNEFQFMAMDTANTHAVCCYPENYAFKLRWVISMVTVLLQFLRFMSMAFWYLVKIMLALQFEDWIIISKKTKRFQYGNLWKLENWEKGKVKNMIGFAALIKF